MNQEERMHANLPYRSWLDGLSQKRLATRKKTFAYNNIPPERYDERPAAIKSIVKRIGTNFCIEAPFNCDYGENIEIGDNFYSNYNFIILDVGKVTIGNNCMFGPNVTLCTAGHPVHPETRASGYEYGIDITIGDNVWIGCNVEVLPGVHIGNNAVIGAGSVVTKDVLDNVIAFGNPCKVQRLITEADKNTYFKGRKFDFALK